MKKYKFGVLGAGNMGTAISEGAVRARSEEHTSELQSPC